MLKTEKNKTKTKKHKTLLQASFRNLENPPNIAFRQSEGILLQKNNLFIYGGQITYQHAR